MINLPFEPQSPPNNSEFSEAESILRELSQEISGTVLKIDFSALDGLKTRILMCKENLISEKDSLIKEIDEVQSSCDKIKEKSNELRRKLDEIKFANSDFKAEPTE